MELGDEVPASLAGVNRLINEFDHFVEDATETLAEGEAGSAGTAGTSQGTNQSSYESTNFTSSIYNVVNQILLTLKMDALVETTIKSIKAGQKPFVTVSNTMETIIKDIAEGELQDDGTRINPILIGDPTDMSFQDVMLRVLAKTRTVRKYDALGNPEPYYLTDKDLGRLGVQAFEDAKQAIMDAGLTELPASPIDYFHYKMGKAGYKFGEMTGRTVGLEYRDNGPPLLYKRNPDDLTKSGKQETLLKYQDGEIDGLFGNRSASTGLSAHAAPSAKDQRVRHMIVAQPETNIDDFMQMLGRVHRTGQVTLPKFTLLLSDMPVENRPAAVLMKKLASLNANTTSARKGKFDFDVPDVMNDVGDQVTAELLEDFEELHERLGYPLARDNRGRLTAAGAARKATGRVALLSVPEQTDFWKVLVERYAQRISELDALGENPLSAKDLPLGAKVIARNPISDGDPEHASPFGQPAYLEKANVKRLGKPFTWEKMRERALEFVEKWSGGTPQHEAEIRQTRVRNAFEVFKADQVAAATTEESGVRIGKRLDERYREFDRIFGQIQIGMSAKVGDLVGMITSIEQKGNPKNPAAAGSWHVRVDVADAARSITFPLSRTTRPVEMGGLAFEVGVSREQIKQITGYSGMREAFDAGQSESHEERYIVTGNMLAGYGIEGMGQRQIVHYTDDQGGTKVGILLSRAFEPKGFIQKQPVQLSRPDQALEFIEEINRYVVEFKELPTKTADGNFGVGFGNGSYVFTTHKAKARGAKYYLNEKVRKAAGGDFTSTGSKMIFRTPDREVAKKIIRAMYKEGFPLVAMTDKDIARRIMGLQSGKDQTETLEGGGPAPAQEAEFMGRARLERQSRSGMPAGVAHRGKRFAAELMEATRHLRVTARFGNLSGAGTKGELRQSSLHQADAIVLGDVSNTRTMAHEMGHMLDFTVWGWPDPSHVLKMRGEKIMGDRRPLTHRIPAPPGMSKGVAERTYIRELTSITAYMRDMAEGNDAASREYNKYRSQSMELMADFIALYVHDPASTRAFAPTFTEQFELWLATSDTKHAEIVRNLLPDMESIDPLPGKGTNKPIEKAVTDDAEMNDILLRAKKEPDAAAAARSLMLGVKRTHKAKLAGSFAVSEEWQSRLSKTVAGRLRLDTTLEDIGAAVEGTGNIRIKDDTIEDVMGRLSPAAKTVLKDYRFAIEQARQEVNKYIHEFEADSPEYLAYVEDYLAHFYVFKNKKALNDGVTRWQKNSPNAKLRTIPTLQEAVELGLTPLSQNVVSVYRKWNEINWRVATNRRFVKVLGMMQDSEGNFVVSKPNEAPAGWKTMDHPALKRIYAHSEKDSKGRTKTILWTGNVAIHPDVMPAVQMMLQKPFSNKWVHGLETFNAWAKKASLSFSLFHHVALTESAQAVLARGYNPVRGIVVFFERNPVTGRRNLVARPHKIGLELTQQPEYLEDSIRHGLNTSSLSDYHVARIQKQLEALEANTRHVPFIRHATRGTRQFNQEWDRALWDRYHAGLKAYAYYDLLESELKRRRKVEMSEAEITLLKTVIASHVNDAFGGQEWEAKMWATPQVQQMMQLGFLAPDWTISNIRIAGQTLNIKGHSALGRAQRRYWRNMIPTLYISAAAMQAAFYAAFGDPEEGDEQWMWNNEKGHEWDIDVTPLKRKLGYKDKERLYIHFGKQARETIRYFQDPIGALVGKSSPMVHVALEQATGTEGLRFDTSFREKYFWEGIPDRARYVVEKFVPFSFRDNNFAFSAPMSKGMTAWKARQRIESSLELQADPSLVRYAARRGYHGVIEYAKTPKFVGNLKEHVNDTLDAALANGVDTDRVFKEALGNVRGRFYRRFFAALEKGNAGDIEAAARSVLRLNASVNGIFTSANRRGIDLTYEERMLIIKTMQDQNKRLRDWD